MIRYLEKNIIAIENNLLAWQASPLRMWIALAGRQEQGRQSLNAPPLEFSWHIALQRGKWPRDEYSAYLLKVQTPVLRLAFV